MLDIVKEARQILEEYDNAEIYWKSPGIVAMEQEGARLIRGLLERVEELEDQVAEKLLEALGEELGG